jgi:hypothetical protein
MIRIDMSEYRDGEPSVDKLIGTPPGIVGGERDGAQVKPLRRGNRAPLSGSRGGGAEPRAAPESRALDQENHMYVSGLSLA